MRVVAILTTFITCGEIAWADEFTLNVIHPNSQAFGFEKEESLGAITKGYARIEYKGTRILFVASKPQLKLTKIKAVNISSTIAGSRSVVVELPDHMRALLRELRLNPTTDRFALMMGGKQIVGVVRTVAVSNERCRFSVPVLSMAEATTLSKTLAVLVEHR